MVSLLSQAEQTAKWEAARDGEVRRLKRERRALDQQMQALAKLPTRRDRSEVCVLSVAASNYCPPVLGSSDMSASAIEMLSCFASASGLPYRSWNVRIGCVMRAELMEL